MKLKFKLQSYQTNAVESVVDCFVGQPFLTSTSCHHDRDKACDDLETFEFETDYRNAALCLSDSVLLQNIRSVQKSRNLPLSKQLVDSAGCRVNLDVEMETGTGKTYCYIKTIFEMNKRYGWSKFIVMVPSIAIREGVYKTFDITADHFAEAYGKRAQFFIYHSRHLHKLESFSSDAGINVMIINMQAFNARGADSRRIYEELDDFQSRKPIDIISHNHPILILDEPQKMGGKATREALSKFKPLMILRYSATHKMTHNRVYRLDALDAYNQKLVKKIAVRGITVKGLTGTNAFLYLESIQISKNLPPIARVEMEVRKAGCVRRVVKYLNKGSDLYGLSGNLDQYRGFVISQIDYRQDAVEFTNGAILTVGDVIGDVTESVIRRIQIREAIKVHLEKEAVLFAQGVKILSLFFIDEVVKYRDYDREDEKGEYARIFEEEYEKVKQELLDTLVVPYCSWRKHLENIDSASTHSGYFSIDKKTKHLVDPGIEARGENAGLSSDVDAYDLILKKKEQLLSFEEPVRFIFSHSALREGWDNPNVFVICMLKHSDNTISRRQEIGRGLRLAVNQNGDRMDHHATIHDINILTVIASESYKDFVSNLQKEIGDTLYARPCKADKDYFTGKIIQAVDGRTTEVTPELSEQIRCYLIEKGYTDDSGRVSDTYRKAREDSRLHTLPDVLIPYSESVYCLIDSVFREPQLPVADDRRSKLNLLNDNFKKKEFQELWARINKQAVYRVEFDSTELIRKCISALNRDLKVAPLQYIIHSGIQKDQITGRQFADSKGFSIHNTQTGILHASAASSVQYDLLSRIAENVDLTRKTLASILGGIEESIFDQFKKNPEHFIAEASRLINEQKAPVIIEKLTYEEISGARDASIFTAGQARQDVTRISEELGKLGKHIYDYVLTDSRNESAFVQELESSDKVVVYAKLPRGFLIPTPVGDYDSGWAISFSKGQTKYIYFVAETKGSMSSMQLRDVEKRKIECARKFFDKINLKIEQDKVKYDVIDSFSNLMDAAGAKA